MWQIYPERNVGLPRHLAEPWSIDDEESSFVRRRINRVPILVENDDSSIMGTLRLRLGEKATNVR